MSISATSPTLQIARQRVPAPADKVLPAVPRGAFPSPGRVAAAAATAFAVTVSWLAAGALVIGLVWAASAASPSPPTDPLHDTLPYAVAWSAGSLAALGASLGSLFTGGGRRVMLLALAAVLAVALAGVAVAANLLVA